MNSNGLVMIRVLGPVDVITTQGQRAIGSRKERLLLAALAVSANHFVSSDMLAEILWLGDPPPSRDNTLQTYVWRLRHLIGEDRIVTSENQSYSLLVSAAELDALVFEGLVAQAVAKRTDPIPCRNACRAALQLWRGVPFGNLADQDPFRLEAIRLDEARMFTSELKLECDLALGREEIAIGALEALVEEYPYRERVWHLLIAALALNGRRVEALRAFHRLEEVLGEVGLEPTPEIRELEDAILTDANEILPRLRFLQRANGAGLPPDRLARP